MPLLSSRPNRSVMSQIRYQFPIFVCFQFHPYSFRPIPNATVARQGDMKAFIQLIYSIPSIRVFLIPLFLFPVPFTVRYHSRDLLLPKVLQLVRSIDSILSLLPTSWTNFSVLVCELECLDDPKTLLYGSSNREIVDVGCPKNTLGIDKE